MPIYEYVCSQCGRRIDVIHGIHAAGPAECEQCGGAMRKALSAPAVVFKGSGWAKVDARASAKSSASASSRDKPDGGSATGDSQAEKPSAAGPSKGETGATADTKSAAD